jgi:crotonobetainyl-CoA:carnitine CoA-transferase CaiB-like acyl-CoA transferase
MSVTGERDALPGGGPQKVGVAVSDLVTGLYACNAVLAALQHRNRTGEGQAIDVALFDCTLAIGANLAFNHVAKGIQPQRYGNAHPTIVPYQVFATSDGHIIVAVGNDSQWQRFCGAIARPDLAAAAHYLHGPDRIVHRETLVAQIAQTLLSDTSAHWLRRLEEFDVPHGGINGYAEAFAHPQALHRQMQVDLPLNSGNGTEAGVANPIKFSASPVQYRRAAPALGADTEDVLKRLRR